MRSQTQDEAERVAYQNVLDEAERHMAEGEAMSGGKCWQCDCFREIQSSECLPAGVRRQLDFCGACVANDKSIEIVDRSEWHSAYECWEVH